MTLEEIRRAFSNPPAEYPKRLDNPGDMCPWCERLTEYNYKNGEHNQPSGWKCPGCQREGYFSVKYQFDPVKAPREIPINPDDPCPQCGNPVRDWSVNLKREVEWYCDACREQGKYQDIPF